MRQQPRIGKVLEPSTAAPTEGSDEIPIDFDDSGIEPLRNNFEWHNYFPDIGNSCKMLQATTAK